MAATVTTANLAAGYTQATLADALVAILTPAYGAPVRSNVSGTLRAVFGPLPKAQAGDRDVWAVLEVTTSFIVTHQLTSSFAAPSTVGPLTGATGGVFGSTGSPIQLTLFHKPGEFAILALSQSSTRLYCGALMPLDLPATWVRATHIPAFNLCSSGMASLNMFSGALNPYNVNQSVALRSPSAVTTEDAASTKRDVLPVLYYSITVANLGHTSPDLAAGAANGTTFLDKIQISAGEEYVILEPTGTGQMVRV